MKRTFALVCLLAVVIVSGCGSGESDPGPAPKFGAAAGPPGVAAGTGAGPTASSKEPVTGAAAEAK